VALPYAIVPVAYWKAKAKQIVDRFADKGPEAALDLLTPVLKDPDFVS